MEREGTGDLSKGEQGRGMEGTAVETETERTTQRKCTEHTAGASRQVMSFWQEMGGERQEGGRSAAN